MPAASGLENGLCPACWRSSSLKSALNQGGIHPEGIGMEGRETCRGPTEKEEIDGDVVHLLSQSQSEKFPAALPLLLVPLP